MSNPLVQPNKRRGYAGNVYRNTSIPTPPTGTPQFWSQIADAQDIKVGDAWTTFEASNRLSPVKKFLNAQLDWSIEFKTIVDLSDEDFIAMQDAHRNGTPINLLTTDGGPGERGTSGPNADWLITDFGRDAPLANGMEITVKCVPHANCRFEPYYLVVQ